MADHELLQLVVSLCQYLHSGQSDGPEVTLTEFLAEYGTVSEHDFAVPRGPRSRLVADHELLELIVRFSQYLHSRQSVVLKCPGPNSEQKPKPWANNV